MTWGVMAGRARALCSVLGSSPDHGYIYRYNWLRKPQTRILAEKSTFLYSISLEPRLRFLLRRSSGASAPTGAEPEAIANI